MKTTEFKRKVKKSALQAEGRRFDPVNSHRIKEKGYNL